MSVCTLIEPFSSLEEQTETLLKEELENCSSLLEMEPDSKWTRYARILIMKALNHDNYHQVIKVFKKHVQWGLEYQTV